MLKTVPQPIFDLDLNVPGLVGERLTLEAFSQLSGNLAGYPFVKVIVDRQPNAKPVVHFINHRKYQFHSDYIAETFLGTSAAELDQRIDEFNKTVYLDPDRRFYLGVLSLHQQKNQGREKFFSIETVEIDTMTGPMLKFFFDSLKASLDPEFPLLFKPANHDQEAYMAKFDRAELPRVLSHELFSNARFIALNAGSAQGRLRAFRSEAEYRLNLGTLEWYDIIVMHKVPDDIPRIAGIINAAHTTPLSHTNVLASGWQIPNSIQLGVFDVIEQEKLDNEWVNYQVDSNASKMILHKLDFPLQLDQRPLWSTQQIKLEAPEIINVPIMDLSKLRMSDRYRYGTKAANLGELKNILEFGSERLIGFYKIKRPPRPNLLSYLAKFLDVPEPSEGAVVSAAPLVAAASEYLRKNIQVPRGIAIPFSLQQEFLESSPRIQQAIGKLKMALELNAREIDSLCLILQSLIVSTRMPDKIRSYIDVQIADALGGVSDFVVRSSSNAEDLENFSGAGIYESINHVTTADNIFKSIKEVWASLLSPRSVRLRHEVGISLDDCYMGVIIQEEVKADLGGVLVTTNPMNRAADFRNVYVNASKHVIQVVQGADLPYQFLFNTVEGGGRTLSIGNATVDLSDDLKDKLQKLSYAGRLLQSHFSPDYTFSAPVDIEWVIGPDGISILQLRPYSQ